MSRDLTKYTKVVYSIDYDGLIDPNYLDELIQHISNRLIDYPDAIHQLRVGSLRNTRYINVINEHGNKNGCCFQFMVGFLDTLHKTFPLSKDHIVLNRMLVEDIANGEAPGTNFDKGLNLNLNQKAAMLRLNPPPEIHWHDELKNSQLYLQLHDSHTPAEKTLFEFFDDRLDILNSLYCLFDPKNTDFLPAGETLQLHQVEKGYFSTTYFFNPLFGKGPADLQYKKTTTLFNNPLAVELNRHSVNTELQLIPFTRNPYDLIAKLLPKYLWHDIVYEIQKVSDITKKEKLYDALLRNAIVQNQTGNVSQLATFGVNPTLVHSGTTPIELAAIHQHWQTIQILSQNPTDKVDSARYGAALILAAENKEIKLAIHLAKQIPTPIHRVTPETSSRRSIFYYAICFKSDALLDAVLENQDINNPEFINLLSTALRYAYTQNNTAAIKKLLPYCQTPSLQLLVTSEHHTEDGIFDCVFDYIKEQKIPVAKEVLHQLFERFTQKESSTLSELILQTDYLSKKEKNTLIALKQKRDESLRSDVVTKTTLRDLITTSLEAMHEVSNVHKNLHQLYTQICALEGDTLSDDAITTLMLIFEEVRSGAKDTIEFLYSHLIASAILSHPTNARIINEMTERVNNPYKLTRIQTLHQCYLTFHRIMYGENTVDAEKTIQFISDHLYDDEDTNNPGIVTQYVNEYVPQATPVQNLLDAINKQITTPCNTSCKNAYRALKTAILIDSPTDHASLTKTISRWKKAPNDIFLHRTNEVALQESDDMQPVRCRAFSKPHTQKRFLKTFNNLFEKQFKPDSLHFIFRSTSSPFQ